jgi:hypothetical protein
MDARPMSFTDRVRQRYQITEAARQWRTVALARGEPADDALHRRAHDRAAAAPPLAHHVRRRALRSTLGVPPVTAILTVTCDRCTEVVSADRTLLLVETGPMRPRRESIDLCPSCVEGLGVWLREPTVERSTAGVRA